MEVQRRQFHIKIGQSENQGYSQVDQGPGEGVADGLAGFAGLFWRGCGPLVLKSSKPAEIARIKAAEIKRKRHIVCSFLLLHKVRHIISEICE